MITGQTLDAVSRAGIQQIASVVTDLESSVRFYSDVLGIGPWTAYALDSAELRDVTYRGRPEPFAIRHALAWRGDVQFELVQPVRGASIWQEHLDERGPGLHHLGAYVDDHAAAVAELSENGFRQVQSAAGFGATGDGAFAYFETDLPFASLLEVIAAPSTRRPELFVYPNQED